MKSLFVFLTAVFLVAAAAPALAEDTTDYGTILNVINKYDPKTIQGMTLNSPENPVWSPDSKTIAFTGAGGKCIYTVPATGGEPALIYDNTGKQKGMVWKGEPIGGGGMVTLGFTPDGKEITFRDSMIDPARGDTMIVDPAYMKDMPRYIYCTEVVLSVNIATGAVRTVVEEAQGGNWSPDGRYFAYQWLSPNNATVKSSGIRILDTKTGENKMLDWCSGGVNSPNFTPDSKYVIYNRLIGMSYNLLRIPVTGGTPEQLTFLTGGTPIPALVYPSFSPDGTWLLFEYSHRIPEKNHSFWYLNAMNMNTGELFELIPDIWNSNAPRWSPGGKKIAYKYYNNIYILDFPSKSMTKILPTSVAETAPVNFAITGNYPNPFNPSTTISFTLPETGRASLAIYNASGQNIRELVSGTLPAGKHSVVWDGRNQNGSAVSSGVYISRLMMRDKVTANRMLLMK